MSQSLTVQIMSFKEVIQFDDVKKVSAPGQLGDLTILPQHASMVIGMQPGKITLTPSGFTLDIGGGFVKIQNNQVDLMVFSAPEPYPDIPFTFE